RVLFRSRGPVVRGHPAAAARGRRVTARDARRLGVAHPLRYRRLPRLVADGDPGGRPLRRRGAAGVRGHRRRGCAARRDGESADARRCRAEGRTLATAIDEAWGRAVPAPVGSLAIRTARVRLPAPSLSLRNCTRPWVPRALTVPLGRGLPRETELIAGALGATAWVTIPGE